MVGLGAPKPLEWFSATGHRHSRLSCFQVIGRSAKDGGIVLKTPDADIAQIAEQAAYKAGLVIVVDA